MKGQWCKANRAAVLKKPLCIQKYENVLQAFCAQSCCLGDLQRAAWECSLFRFSRDSSGTRTSSR